MAYPHQFELRAGQLLFQGDVLGAELGGRQRVHGETRTTGHGLGGHGGSGGLVPGEGVTLGGGGGDMLTSGSSFGSILIPTHARQWAASGTTCSEKKEEKNVVLK